jgi:CBS domain-containing protein
LILQTLNDTALFPLKSSDKVGFALETLLEYGVEALPVVDNEHIIGFFEGKKAIGIAAGKSIKDLISQQPGWILFEGHHQFEFMRRFTELNAGCIAVVDEAGLYIYTVSMRSLVNVFGKDYAFTAEGAIVSLEMPARNYSLNELSRIVEMNDAKIIGISIYNIPDSAKIQVNLKLNTTLTESITSNLLRFGFDVTGTFYAHPEETDFRNRYESLLKYMEF